MASCGEHLASVASVLPFFAVAWDIASTRVEPRVVECGNGGDVVFGKVAKEHVEVDVVGVQVVQVDYIRLYLADMTEQEPCGDGAVEGFLPGDAPKECMELVVEPVANVVAVENLRLMTLRYGIGDVALDTVMGAYVLYVAHDGAGATYGIYCIYLKNFHTE